MTISFGPVDTRPQYRSKLPYMRFLKVISLLGLLDPETKRWLIIKYFMFGALKDEP